SLLLRIDFELRVAGVQALTKGAKADAKREAKRNKKREAKAKVKQAMQSAEDQAEEASFVDDEETRHD
ncbi:MAG: hypothetical protein GY923_10690, partial [Aestuariibacter sp.]|nr:hypothetical protein [Aestuariibacter sp.]